jgi:cytochrome P450
MEGVENEKNKDVAVEDSEDGGKCPVTALKEHVPFVERLMNRGKLSREDIQSASGPLLMAGVDTTAYVLSWVFLNLASNTEKQQKLAEQLQTVLKGDDLTTLEQMNSLPYLKACIRESHRLTPSAPISVKKLNEDIDVVVDDKAYRVIAGQRISLNLRAYPMDPRFVENPTQYNPERFLPDAVKARKGTPSEVIDHPSFADPFGRGKRRCLGSNVAIAEIRILVARLIQDYEITLVDPNDAQKWKPKQKLLLKADPYPSMKLVRRV